MSSKINPLTGLPMGEDTNPLTGLKYDSQVPTINPLTGVSFGVGNFEDYEEYGVQMSPYFDMEEERAQRQSRWEKWGNGLAKAGVTAVGATAEGTIGALLGLGDYVLSGFDDFGKSMSENPIGKYFDEVNEGLRESMPNYQTKEERADQGDFSSMLYANFWADKFLNGAAYTVGSLAAGFLTGSTGILTNAAAAGARAVGASEKISKSLAAYRAAKAARSGKNQMQALRSAVVKRGADARNAKAAANMLESGAMMSMAEAAVEARETKTQVRDRLIEEAKKKKMRSAKVDLNAGVQVNSWEDIELTPRELQQIELQAQQAEGAAFYGNMAVLMPTNLLMFGKMITPYKSAGSLGGRIAGETGKKQFISYADDLPQALQKFYKPGKFVGRLGKRGAIESYQESMQYAITQGVSDYESRRLEDAGLGDLVEPLLEQGRVRQGVENIKNTGDILARFGDTMNDKEAREQALIGFLVGIAGGGRAAYRQGKADTERFGKIQELINDVNFYNLARKNEDYNVGMSIVKEMLEAEDEATYNRLQNELITETVISHLRLGSFDAFYEKMMDAKNLSDEEFKAQFGIADDFVFDEGGKEQIVDRILKHAEKIQEGHKIVENYFYKDRTTGLPALLMSKERKEQEQKEIEDQEIYKNAIIRNYAVMETMDADINQILNELEQLLPEFGVSRPAKEGEKRGKNSLKKRLQRYRRTKFGDVIIDPVTDEEVKTMPFKSRIGGIFEEVLQLLDESDLSDEDKAFFVTNFTKAVELVQQRDTSALAFKNLLTSPKERDLFVSRTKAKVETAQRKKIDALVDAAINDTDDRDSLKAQRASLEAANVSPSALARFDAEVEERNKLESDANNRFEYLTKTQVANLTGLTALEESVRKRHLANREQEEPLRQEPKKAADIARKRALERARNRAANNNRTTQTGNASSPQGTNQTGTNPPGTTSTQGTNSTDAGSTNMHTTTNGQGQFKQIGNKVVVDSDGNLIESTTNADRTLNGEPIIDTSPLANPDVKEGTKVELEVIEDDWWAENKNDDRYTAVKDIPIYIKLDGKYVGALPAGNTAMRQAIVSEYLDAKQNNREPKVATTTISKKYSSNQISAVTEDGSPFFSNAFEVFGDSPVGVVRWSKESNAPGNKVLDVGNTFNLDDAAKASLAIAAKGANLANLTYGQVVFFTKDPTGKWTFNVGHTSNLTEAEVSKVLEAFKNYNDAAYEMIADLVGMNEGIEVSDPGVFGKFFRIETNSRSGQTYIEFTAPAELVGQSRDMIISITPDVLKKILNGEPVDISKFMKDKNAVGNLIKAPTVDKDGNKVLRGIAFSLFNNASDGLAGRIQTTFDLIPFQLATVLAQKKRQVDIDALQVERDYFRTIANEQRPLPEGSKGYTGVIGTTAMAANGSIFRDIGLDLSNKIEIGGKEVQTTNKSVDPVVPNTPEDRPSGQTLDSLLSGIKSLTPDDLANEFEEDDSVDSLEDSLEDALGASGEFDVLGEKKVDDDLMAKLAAAMSGRTQQSEDTNTEETDTEDPSDLLDEDPPFRLADKAEATLNEQQAKAWLKERGIPVEFYDVAKRVGSSVAHGYMKNAVVYLWRNAEVGTEYHEAFHFVFRNLIDDTQRNKLYAEARKYYAESLREKGINPSKATDLQLEEEMAEDFRLYVMTQQESGETAPKGLRKLFQDIWNYIKSIFIGSGEIDKLFRQIETNTLPKTFERSSERFQDNTAYRLVDTGLNRDYKAYKSTMDTLASQFIKTYESLAENASNEERSRAVSLLLGTSNLNRGIIAEYFLRHSFSVNDEAITDAQFETIKDLLHDVQNSELSDEQTENAKKQLRQYLSDNNIQSVAPSKGENNRLPESARNLKRLKEKNNPGGSRQGTATVFLSIYANWFDVSDQYGNVDKYGWRAGLMDDLKKYGYDIESEAVRLNAEMDNDSEDGNFALDETNYDKIYNITHFENNPSKRVTAEVRKLFGKMVKQQVNYLGFYTYADIDSTYKASVHATVGTNTYDEMVANIVQRAEQFPELQPMADYVRSNQISAQEAAMLRRVLNLEKADFRILMEEYNEDSSGTTSKIIASDRRNSTLAWMSQWKAEAFQINVERENALYKYDENDRLVVNNNVIDGKTRLEHIKDNIKAYQTAPSSDLRARAEAMSNIMWYMSMGLGATKNQSAARLGGYFEQNADQIGKIEAYVFRLAGKAFVTERADKGQGPVNEVRLSEQPINIFANEGSTLKELAQIAADYELPTAMAFVSGSGKTIYPYNTASHFSHIVQELKKGTDSELYLKMIEDNAFTAFGNQKLQSQILTLIESGKFEIETFTLDTLKNEETINQEYKQMTLRNAMIMRMNAYLNNGDKYAYYPISIQETRGRIDFIKLPKSTVAKSLIDSGIGRKSQISILSSIIIRDLIRLAENPELAELGLEGFHLSGMAKYVAEAKKNGVNLITQAINAATREDRAEYAEFYKTVSDIADKYLKNEFAENLAEFRERFEELNILQENEEGKFDLSRTRLDSAGLGKFNVGEGGMQRLLTAYAFDDLIARVEIANVLRGGATQAKSVVDFYKRMGLVNTPGDRLMLQGEFANDPSYGFLKEVVQGVISPVSLTDKEHDKIAKRLKDELKKTMSDAEAEAIVKDYRIKSKADRTDAQAFISPIMFKHIEQGLGRWTAQDDVWFNEYLNNNGEWKARYTPNYKFYYENLKDVDGTIKTEMDKNSYVVLTRDLVAGTDVLKEMYNKMMAEGAYEGQGYVHLINTTSAKKGYSVKPIDVSNYKEGMFNELNTSVQDGARFLMPQIINMSGTDVARFNRQIRKNMLAALDRDATYYLDGKEVKGQELFDRYGNAIEKILEIENKKLLDEMGYNEMKADPNNIEKRVNFLRKIRDMIQANAMRDNSMDSNMQEQLKIIENDIVDFSVPASFPVYQRRYQNLLFSLFKNNVYRINMPGSELVQVAGVGKFKIQTGATTAAVTNTAEKDVKDGVKELFESNPELANTVYEALGFKQEGSNIEILTSNYTRQSVQNDVNTLYLFTDNAQRTSRPTAKEDNVDKNSWYYKKYKSQTNKPIHFGSTSNPTSAVIRGLNNAYPISTMSAYGTNWTNYNFDLFKQTIDDEINQIKQDLPKFDKVKIGNFRIGQGGRFAKLPQQHQEYLDNKLLEIGIDNTGNNPKIINKQITPEQKQQAQQLYSQYLDTIFPDSKVKDIVYHGGFIDKNETFNLDKHSTGEYGKGIYFTPSLESANEYRITMGDAPNLIRAIVNIENPVVFDDKKPKKGKSKEYVNSKLAENPTNDGIIYSSARLTENEYGVDEKLNDEVKVNSAKQVHILGSKKDIAGFKEFAKGGTEQRELRFLDIKEGGKQMKAAEVMVSEDVLEKFGIKVGETGIAYRIPHQGYSSTVGIKVVGVLPRGYSKTIMVPGNITVMTGSDFDIDKLFTLFRDNKSGDATAKYKNEIMSILESIALSTVHMRDTLKPLSQDTLDELAERPEIAKEGMYSFDHPLSEVTIEANYKSAATLVGGYANALAGFSVAVHASSLRGEGMPIDTSTKHFTVKKDGKTYVLDRIQAISPMTNQLASEQLTERLSAALDAAKKIIHLSINDNKHTLNAIVYLASIGMDAETIVYLMAQEPVRQFVEQMDNRGDSASAKEVFTNMGLKSTLSSIQKNEISKGNPESQGPATLDFDALKEALVDPESVTPDFRKAITVAFAHAYYAGDELADIYKIITPDTVDGMGDLAEIEAYLDIMSRVKMNMGNSLVGASVINSILEGDAYPLSRGFYNALNKSIEVSSELFLGGTESVKTFKESFKRAVGKKRLTAKTHRTIDRALFYHMLTKEGSPLAPYLDKANIAKIMLDPNDNLGTELKRLYRAVPALRNNVFLSKLVEKGDYNDPKKRVYTLSMDSIEKMTPEVKQEMINNFKDLMYEDQIKRLYTTGETEIQNIKTFANNLVVNALVTTGLAPTYGAYFDSIPIQFFQAIEMDGVSLMDFYRNEFREAQRNPFYFAEFMFDFARNYGTRTVDRAPMIPTINRTFTASEDGSILTIELAENESTQDLPAFVTWSNRNDKERVFDRVRLYQWNGTAYSEVQTLSLSNEIIEHNLRYNGKINGDSFFRQKANTEDRQITKLNGKKINTNPSPRTGAKSPALEVNKMIVDKLREVNSERQERRCKL